MKKIVSVMLALVLVACMFALTSCDSVKPALEKADKALKEEPYVVKMSMDFECDDQTLNAVFDAMSMEIPITVDGDNMSMDLTMDLMGQSIGAKMSVVDKVLYSNVDMGALGSTKMKATLNDEQLKEFASENGAEMPVDYFQFEKLEMEKKDGKQVITCSGITTEGLTALNEQMGEAVKAMGAEAAAGDLSYVITLADGKYETVALTCSYSITVEGKTYTVSMTMNAKYEYKDVAKVTAPSDADTYIEVGYDDIAG